jgi:hypothetical protein
MTVTIAANAIGPYTLVATNAAGNSGQFATPGNTLTVLSTNPSADADGDGLTDIYELAIGSNPLNPSTSGDGIPDGWALFFGLIFSYSSVGSLSSLYFLTYLYAYLFLF